VTVKPELGQSSHAQFVIVQGSLHSHTGLSEPGQSSHSQSTVVQRSSHSHVGSAGPGQPEQVQFAIVQGSLQLQSAGDLHAIPNPIIAINATIPTNFNLLFILKPPNNS